MSAPRTLRFRGRKEVRALARRGRLINSALGRVCWARTADTSAARVLFVVSSRVAKRASDRNRIRRQLGEAFRHFFVKNPFPAEVIVYVSPAVVAMPGRVRREHAVNLAKNLGIFAAGRRG